MVTKRAFNIYDLYPANYRLSSEADEYLEENMDTPAPFEEDW